MQPDDLISQKKSEIIDISVNNNINEVKIYNKNKNKIELDIINNNINNIDNINNISEKKGSLIYDADNSNSNCIKTNEKKNNKDLIISIKEENKNNILNSSLSTISSKKKSITNILNHTASNIVKKFLPDREEIKNDLEQKEILLVNENCLICDEKLTQNELKDNFIECFHIFCNDCYYEFIKEKVNNNFIEKIKCPKHDCQTKLFDNFIVEKLLRDTTILNKYLKLKEKRQLMLNPKIQLCPFPNCDSYAIKKGKNKYVSCIKYKHEFCFKCLKNWHGKNKCDTSIDESFNNWRDINKVKRCPKCKFFIEKNKGCNYITCLYCKYEFCWICLHKYTRNHFKIGKCSGLLYTDNIMYSNKCINFWRRFAVNLLLSFILTFSFAVCWPFSSYYGFVEFYYGKKRFCQITCGIAGTFACLTFIVSSIPLAFISGFILFLYWPLLDEIILWIEEYNMEQYQ